MPEIQFTRQTGSYDEGDTATMGDETAALLVGQGAAEYTKATPAKRKAPAKKATPKAKDDAPSEDTPPAE